MKSLFLKIFLSFWVAQALFLVLAIVVTLAFRPRSSSWEALLAIALNDSVNAYEQGGNRGLRGEDPTRPRVPVQREHGGDSSSRRPGLGCTGRNWWAENTARGLHFSCTSTGVARFARFL